MQSNDVSTFIYNTHVHYKHVSVEATYLRQQQKYIYLRDMQFTTESDAVK